MWSTCSIETGHAWTHAPHVTQSQTDSSGTVVGHDRIVALGEHLVAQAHDQSFGESTLPVANAGQASWQRPHSVHEKRVEHLLAGQVRGGARAEADLVLGHVVVVEPQRLEPAARRRCARTTR